MAHQADVEMQALPEKLRQEAEGRSLDDLNKARQAGYLPIASVQLDQGADQNTANANAALAAVKAQYGAVPSGLMYIHTGSTMTVLKLQDGNSALPSINAARQAMGQKPIDQNTFSSLAPADRDSMARNALTFDDPRDVHGEISQASVDVANMRLLTVKSQPDFYGKADLVASLQASVDHQTAVLDSGAGASAIRTGKAAGAQAQAAQPGETAAKVAEIQATAAPAAAAAGAKAGAEAQAQFPWQARLEQMKQQGDPVFAFDTKSGQTVQVSRGEAISKGYTNLVKVNEGEIDKAKTAAMQLGDATMNIQSYRIASQKMDELPLSTQRAVAALIGDDKFKAQFMGATVPVDWLNNLLTNENWRMLPDKAKDAVVSYIAARPAAISLFGYFSLACYQSGRAAHGVTDSNGIA